MLKGFQCSRDFTMPNLFQKFKASSGLQNPDYIGILHTNTSISGVSIFEQYYCIVFFFVAFL